MGYACPVCGDPQADPPHLANHVAFTALIRGGDHEAWLDEHVPGWADLDEDALGERLVAHADGTEFPQVFEDTTGDHGSDDGHDHGRDRADRGVRAGIADATGAEAVLAEARELTRRRHGNAGGGEEADGSRGAGSADADADDSETE